MQTVKQTIIITVNRFNDEPIEELRACAKKGLAVPGHTETIDFENEFVISTEIDGENVLPESNIHWRNLVPEHFNPMLNAIVDYDANSVITHVEPLMSTKDVRRLAEENDMRVFHDDYEMLNKLEADGTAMDVRFDGPGGNAYKPECMELIGLYTQKNGWDSLYRVIEHLDPMKVQHPKQAPERTMVERYCLATEPLLDVAKAEIARQVARLGGDIKIDEAEHGSYDEPFDGRYTPERIYMQDGVPMLQCCAETTSAGAYLYDLMEVLNVLELCYLADYLAAI